MSRTAQLLIVVLLLLVIIAILVICATQPLSRSGPRETTLRRMDVLALTVRKFQVQKGRTPTGLAEIVGWGRLDPSVTNDGWGRPLMFLPFDKTLGCGSIVSYGKDGESGGVGESCDIRTKTQ